MSAVLCLPACLCVSPQRPVARPPTGTRQYLFTAVKMTLRVGTSVNSVNVKIHNANGVTSTRIILESIVLYVPVWFLTALRVLQSTYLIKLRQVSFFLRPVRLQKFVTFLITPPLCMLQLLLILTDFTYIATLQFYNRADLLEQSRVSYVTQKFSLHMTIRAFTKHTSSLTENAFFKSLIKDSHERFHTPS